MLKKLSQIFIPLIGGGITALIMQKAMDYKVIVKPPLSPPAIIFPIAWSILYLLIGISYFLYRKNNNNEETKKTYYLGLIFNYLWTIIFFNLKWRLLSIFWILILIALTIKLMVNYHDENKISYYLLIPYLLWLIFATYLNIGVFILN